MPCRTLKQVIPAIATSDGAGVKLLRSLGQSQQRLDPFLMLDEFSSMNADDYIAGFPDHPHRGFETVTYMLDGNMRIITKSSVKVKNIMLSPVTRDKDFGLKD